MHLDQMFQVRYTSKLNDLNVSYAPGIDKAAPVIVVIECVHDTYTSPVIHRNLSTAKSYPQEHIAFTVDKRLPSILLAFLLLEILFNCPNEFSHHRAAMRLSLRPQAFDQGHREDKSDFLGRALFILHADIIHVLCAFAKPSFPP